MKSEDISRQLRQVMLFRRLSDEQFSQVAGSAVYVHLDQGGILFEQQDPADRFFFLLSGRMKLYRLSLSGSEKVIEVISPGATFAEALVFMEKPTYPIGAMALEESRLISIDGRQFVGVLKQSVGTLLMIAADMSQRLHGLLREINDLSLHSGTCRVATYLMDQTDGINGVFDLDLPKQVLASRLSLKPETLSRIFRSMINAGLIQIEGNHVSILDKAHLADLADMWSAGETSLGSTFYHADNDDGDGR